MVIDVELLEVDRTRLREYGLQIASRRASAIGISGSADVNREGFTLQNLLNLTQADVFLSGVPGALLSAAEKRRQHSNAGESPAADVGRAAGAGAIR